MSTGEKRRSYYRYQRQGGVGKTNVTVNLAIALSEMGKRVAILDADFGLANIDVMLGIIPS